MLDAALTCALLAVLGWMAVWKNTPRSGPFSFDKDLTTYLKGFCAVIVVLTHVPAAFVNPVQKTVHSFGTVAVTLFFLISAYGMSFSAAKNPQGYLAHFWRNRLANLLVPWLLVRLCWVAYAACIGKLHGAESLARWLFRFPLYVQILLQFCLLFYVVMLSRAKGWLGQRAALAVLAAVVSASAVFLYLHPCPAFLGISVSGWPSQRMGLVWGLLLFGFFPAVAAWMDEHHTRKTLLAGILAAGLGIAYLAFKSVWFWGGFVLRVAMSLAIIGFVLLSLRKHRLGNKASDWLGRVSYEVYLSHDLVMAALARFFPAMPSGCFVVLALSLTLLLSTGIHAVASRLVSAIRFRPSPQNLPP